MTRQELPDLDSLRCFIEAARLLNFRAAARSVGLTPAALGQRIKRLEEQFEVALFHRSTRRVVLTEAGMALLPVAQRAVAAAEECRPAALGETGPVEQDITIGTRHELGLSWVLPLLPSLRESFPGVTVHLYFGSGSDLELRVRSQEIDCAISSRQFTDPKLEGVRLHREDYVLCASGELLAKAPLEVEEDLAGHVVIDIDETLPLFRYWRSGIDRKENLSFGSLRRMGTISAIHRLVLQGEGVAVLPHYLVRSDLASGALQAVLPQHSSQHDFFRLFYRVDDPRTALFRAFADVLGDHELRA